MPKRSLILSLNHSAEIVCSCKKLQVTFKTQQFSVMGARRGEGVRLMFDGLRVNSKGEINLKSFDNVLQLIPWSEFSIHSHIKVSFWFNILLNKSRDETNVASFSHLFKGNSQYTPVCCNYKEMSVSVEQNSLAFTDFLVGRWLGTICKLSDKFYETEY